MDRSHLYPVLAQAGDDPMLEAACERILLDERGHVAFHRATLSTEFGRMPAPARAVAVLSWRAFVAAVASVVAWDHRGVLGLARVSRTDFAGEVGDERAGSHAFSDRPLARCAGASR